jgi:hypothetical protein
MNNKDQKLIAEAYEHGVWNQAIKHAQGYKVELDHFHVSLDLVDGDEKIYKIVEHTKDNKIISIFYYRPKPEAWNDERSMTLTSTDISRILSSDIKKTIRKKVQDLEIEKYDVDKDVKDAWRGAISKL